MRCPACGQENPAGVKFCGECGTRLDRPCPGCGTANPPANKFCHECGLDLAGTPSLPAGLATPKAYTPAHLALARLAHTRGDHGAAATHLREARDLFRALSAPRYVARAEQLAAELGIRFPDLAGVVMAGEEA